jgi:hypothetical protein
MNALRFSAILAACAVTVARADLTIVQKVDGIGAMNEMTIKIKGDKARVEASPQAATIIDSKTGDIVNVMTGQKQFMRISAAQAKAAAAMAMGGATDETKVAQRPQLKPTGKKLEIDGYETDEYVFETPQLSATYWIAANYPNAAEIVKQLQSMTSEAWGTAAQGMPDYRDFPGLPLRSRVSVGGQQITTTLASVKHDPLPDSEFAPPAGFTEMKVPDMNALLGGGKSAAPKPSASPKR